MTKKDLKFETTTSLKLTASLHLKMDGLGDDPASWGVNMPIFRGELAVSFREGKKHS